MLDDGNDDDMRDLAARHGVGYIRRDEHTGAKAGNINNALALTSAPFIAVFDSDHVADPTFLEATLGHMDDPKIAFVQTPQYYANTEGNRIASASWAQQALFFGAIARGKDYAPAWELKGRILWGQRRTEEARAAFEQYLELKPTGSTADRIRELIGK